jgi:hypothetical protein
MRRRCNGARPLLALALAALAAACSGSGGGVSPAPSPAPVASTPSETEAVELTRVALPWLALVPADLPEGFFVRREGFVEAGEPIEAVYRRAFDPGGALLGRSVLADLVSDVVLFGSSEEADAALAEILDGLSGEQTKQYFATILRSYTGIVPEDLNGQTLASPVVADGAVVAQATFGTPVGGAEALLFIVRIGRLHANLFLIGPPGQVELEDGAALAAIVIERMRVAVAAAGPEA